ncbi:hypothetical protein MSPP1_001496 [Malassezia sp. CBS 17886]|nr:hypothetical protein MSPP1_001496 [Malassezia sp. CBS 17886]
MRLLASALPLHGVRARHAHACVHARLPLGASVRPFSRVAFRAGAREGASRATARTLLAAGAAGTVGYAALCAAVGPVAYSDAGTALEYDAPLPLADALSTEHRFPLFSIIAWGSNQNRVVAPSREKSAVRTPSPIPAYDGVALRDVALGETYGAAVDAAGDVLQWGVGFSGDANAPPEKTLVGMDIAHVQLCGPKVYALSRSGDISVFASSRSAQNTTQRSAFAALVPGTPRTNVEHVLLSTPGREKFASIAGGEHHLLALSRVGRVWSAPVDAQANDYGQLGYTRASVAGADGTQTDAVFEPVVLKKGAARASPPPASPTSDDTPSGGSSVMFATELRAVPSLADVPVAQIAAGSLFSVVRTAEGRVLAWGCNRSGQLGVRSPASADTVAVPTEVQWHTSTVGKSPRCTYIAAGGTNAFFVVQSAGNARTDGGAARANMPASPTRIDVLAAGSGQRGSLGNAQRSQVCSVPVRVQNVSGMQEYSEAAHALVPIGVRTITVGSSGQCALVLDTPQVGEETRRDVYVWGANDAGQLGNGKRGNTATPALLTMSPDAQEDARSAPVMDRVLLVQRENVEGHPFGGRPRKYRVVEQNIVAGGSSMAIYTRVVS